VVINVNEELRKPFRFLECADLSALWSAATCRSLRSLNSSWPERGDRSPHSKERRSRVLGLSTDQGDGVFEHRRDDSEAFADGFG